MLIAALELAGWAGAFLHRWTTWLSLGFAIVITTICKVMRISDRMIGRIVFTTGAVMTAVVWTTWLLGPETPTELLWMSFWGIMVPYGIFYGVMSLPVRSHNRCQNCDCDLRTLGSEVCPECGASITPR